MYLPRTKNFPLNTEVEATLTFAGDDPGQWVKDVTPSPESITVREHHSFVQLPPPGYKPRAYDPRSGFFGISYMDYATPISEPIVKRFIARHRLEKKDPTAAMSEAVEPIVYYLDRGTPEPIRSALLEGAQLVETGVRGRRLQERVPRRMMPEGADPMDLRYNVIQWVHRATRGWSYGEGIIDPRTGEIIKGQVSLGSLRVRQDYLIAEGLLAPYEKGKPVSPKMQEMALARLRQLAAHEVGHTLGLDAQLFRQHGESLVGDGLSAAVRDARRRRRARFLHAYATGIGEWDKVSITWGYQDFPPERRRACRAEQNSQRRLFAAALRFLTDQDARPAGSSSSAAHLWDSGANAVDELESHHEGARCGAETFWRKQYSRRRAARHASKTSLVPIYLLHRYQVEAASKLVGGMDYTFALRGDGEIPTQIVAAGRTAPRARSGAGDAKAGGARAARAVAENHSAAAAVIIRAGANISRFARSPAFDAVAPAEAAAQLIMQFLFNPQRAARLVEFHARDAANPALARSPRWNPRPLAGRTLTGYCWQQIGGWWTI